MVTLSTPPRHLGAAAECRGLARCRVVGRIANCPSAVREDVCYNMHMTKQGLEILFEHVATWPAEAQEELVQSMAAIEKKHLGVYRLNDEERMAVRRGLREMRERKIATDDEVAEVFNRYRA